MSTTSDNSGHTAAVLRTSAQIPFEKLRMSARRWTIGGNDRNAMGT